MLILFLLFSISATSTQAAQSADLQIKLSADTAYIGDDIYNTSADDQTVAQDTLNNQLIVYHIRIQNDGAAYSGYNVSATAGGDGWEIKYYSAITGGGDVTADIIVGSWSVQPLTPTYTTDFRVEIKPDTTILGDIAKSVYITITATTGFTKDIVRAITTCAVNPKPDLAIKQSTADSYIGDDIYNLTGENQTLPKNVNNTVTLTYYIKIQNYGNTTGFYIVGTASAGGWTMNYFDASEGGTDITNDVRTGWNLTLTPTAVTYIRVEVTPDLTVAAGATQDVNITIRSTDDLLIGDMVTVSSTCVQGATLSLSIGSRNHAASYELNTTDKLSMLQFQISIPQGNETVEIDNLVFTAGGTADDVTDISGLRLIDDANGNGFYDSGDSVIAGPAVFGVNDGTANIAIAPPLSLNVESNKIYLMIYQLGQTGTAGQTLELSLTSLHAVGAYSRANVTPLGLPLKSNTKTISDISVSTTTGLAPLAVSFSAQFGTAGSVVQYEWDFDYDGLNFRPDYKSYMAGNITYTYTLAGSYTALLKVSYFDGSVINRLIDFTIQAPTEQPIIYSIITSPSPPVVPAPADITFTASAFAQNGIKAYLWDFDGDNIVDLVSPTSATTNTALYNYTEQGTYILRLKVEDNEGLMSLYQRTVNVSASVSATPTAQIISPTNPANITICDSISFIGEGTPGAGGSIAKYEWDLDGDGNFDVGGTTVTNTAYTYVHNGTYTVRFKVTETPSGLTKVATLTVNVTRPAVANSPRLAFIQPGNNRANADGLRGYDYGEITLRLVSLPIQSSNQVDLRYRQIGMVLTTTFIAPDDDPLPLSSDKWWTDQLANYDIINEEITQEEFMTTLALKRMEPGNWYEVIALVNYNQTYYTYADYNAVQMNKRLFIYNDSWDPEYREDNTKHRLSLTRERAVQSCMRGEARLSVPYDSVSGDTTITMTTVAPASAPSGELSHSLDQLIGVYQSLDLDPGKSFTKPIQIKLSYPDADNNGIVDGTDNIPESSLKLYSYSDADQKWYSLSQQMVDCYNNLVIADVYEPAVIGIVGQLPEVPIITGSSGPKMDRDWAFCAIATAAYGSPLAGQLNILRAFRDTYLLTDPIKRQWVRCYYKYSPPAANLIKHSPLLRWFTRQTLQSGTIILFTPDK